VEDNFLNAILAKFIHIFKEFIMKKHLFGTLLIVIFAFSTANSFGGFDQKLLRIYGGLSVGSVNTSNFNNFCISDWEKYGLLSQNSSSSEGRVIVGLSDAETEYKFTGMKLGGFIGADYEVMEKGRVLFEYNYNFGTNFSMMGFSLGFNYDLLSSGDFNLGITPKVGYSIGTVDLGIINPTYIVWSNGSKQKYTDPVIITEGSFSSGDKLSTNIGSVTASLGLTPVYNITKNIGIRGYVGFGLGLTGDTQINVTTTTGDVKINMDSKAVVKYGTSSEQAGFKPTVAPTGLIFQLGINYTL
jgi:hypothetical protein